MKLVNFLKTRSVLVLIILGTAVFLVVATFVQTSIGGRNDIPTAQEAGRDFGLIVQSETLMSLSYIAGASLELPSSMVRTTVEQNLKGIISQNQKLASDFGAYSNMSDEEIMYAAANDRNSGNGIFSNFSTEDMKGLGRHPQAFIQESQRVFQVMAKASQSLMDIYDSRIDRVMENFGMSADEVFDLARENKVNLFAYPENFLQIMVELGLNWTEADRQAPGVNLDSDYLDEIHQDSFQFFNPLVDSMGSFFNACTQC